MEQCHTDRPSATKLEKNKKTNMIKKGKQTNIKRFKTDSSDGCILSTIYGSGCSKPNWKTSII